MVVCPECQIDDVGKEVEVSPEIGVDEEVSNVVSDFFVRFFVEFYWKGLIVVGEHDNIENMWYEPANGGLSLLLARPPFT